MKNFFIVILFFCTTVMFGASSGPLSPGIYADGTAGTGGVNWVNDANVTISFGSYAEVTAQAKNKTTNYFNITNFGFALPAGTIVTGVVVE